MPAGFRSVADGKIDRFTRPGDQRRGQGGAGSSRNSRAGVIARSTGASTRADGRCCPDLIDAHGHVMALGLQRAAARLDRHKIARGPAARLKAYAAAHPQARWILGRGWNQELWPGREFPTAADIDAVVSRPPGLARPRGRPCRHRQQRGHEGGRVTSATHGRPPRRRGSRTACSSMRQWPWYRKFRRPQPRTAIRRWQGAGTAARRRHHRCRRHGHQPRRLGGHEPRGQAPAAQRPYHRLRGGNSVDDGNQRRPADAAGSTATGCAWSASRFMPTERSARAAPALKRPYADQPDTRGSA